MLARRIKKGWMPLRVKDIIDETHDTKTFILEDADDGGRPFDFIAGQYLTFRFDTIAEKPLVRSYTMSGSPFQENETIFTVKRVEQGLVSNWLCDHVKVGDILKARGPIGRFVPEEEDNPHLVMIAGGSGVTPFISIMREFINTPDSEKSEKRMSLLVAYRSTEDLILWKDIQEIQAHPRCQVFVTLTRSHVDGFWHGRPDDAMLTRLFDGQYNDITVMTCGPQQMMDLVVEHGRKHGMTDRHLKTESFL